LKAVEREREREREQQQQQQQHRQQKLGAQKEKLWKRKKFVLAKERA